MGVYDQTTKDAIDELLFVVEGFSSSEEIADVRNRRRAKRNLQKASNYIWGLREFSFSQFRGSGTLICGSDGRNYIDYPAGDDFRTFGTHAVVTIDRRPLTYAPKQKIDAAYAGLGGKTGTPSYFTEPEITGAGSVAIYFFPALTETPGTIGGHTNEIAYRYQTPVLVDSDDDTAMGPEPVGTDGLQFWPLQWRSVISDLAAYYMAVDKGNAVLAGQKQGILYGRPGMPGTLENLLAEERPGRGQPTRLPSYGQRLRGFMR